MTQEALKLALEAMESVTVECNNFHHPKKDQNHHWAKCQPVARWDKAITAIKEALAQTQEPLAYVNIEKRKLEFAHDYVKWDTPTTVKLERIPLYTTPPQRTWGGLTDEEWLSLGCKSVEEVRIGLAIQAKLKEKNT